MFKIAVNSRIHILLPFRSFERNAFLLNYNSLPAEGIVHWIEVGMKSVNTVWSIHHKQ